MKNVLKTFVKSVLIALGLIEPASAADTAVQKKIYGSCLTTRIISNEEMNDIMKIMKSLKDAGLIIKDDSETIENEATEQKDGSLSMFLGTLDSGYM